MKNVNRSKMYGIYQKLACRRQAELTKYRQVPVKVPNLEGTGKSTYQGTKMICNEFKMKALHCIFTM